MADKIELRIQTSKLHQLDLGNAIPMPNKDYEKLINKPQINGVELIGDKTTSDLLIPEYVAITDNEIEAILQSVFD